MSRRSSVLFAAALTLPLSALTIPTAASAAAAPVSRVVLDDPAGDVWAIGEGENAEWVSAGDLPTADVVRAVVRHGRRNVLVRMTFTNLRRVEPQYYTAMIITPRQLRAVFVSAGPRRWGGRHQLVNGNFGTVKCPRLNHSIDYDTEQISMSIPRSCLGQPNWVRVDMTNFMFRGNTEADFQEVTDNPHSADPDGSLTRRLYLPAS
jgi:hypothetical protein